MTKFPCPMKQKIFSEHPKFYLKSDRWYSDKIYKENQLLDISEKVGEPGV
jgi:hypothetical protein